MREIYAGAILLVLWAFHDKPPNPSAPWVLLALFVLFESACWRAAFRARGVTVAKGAE